MSMGWYFLFFFISGFCSILYELVWLRLAMAQFGVTTALVSIVLSMFMAGLGAGSWIAGSLLRRHGTRIVFPPLRLYGLAELLIGCSSALVPWELIWGHRLASLLIGHSGLSSSAHYILACILLGVILVPWCACMGATIPLAMFSIRASSSPDSQRSFSFLYLSNVAGAVAGAVAPLFLIELHGFRGTLRIGMLLNAVVAGSAFGLTLTKRRQSSPNDSNASEDRDAANVALTENRILALLFLTGLATMGMEVVWTRLFTPYLGTVVYSFAIILVSYLLPTFVGSTLYHDSRRKWVLVDQRAWIMLAVFGLLPLLTSDPRMPLHMVVRVVLAIAPFAGLIGFLTPMLVDLWSAGDPDRAGRAYAVNILGCIAGPLLAGFVLLPWLGERVSTIFLAAPWFAMAYPLLRPGTANLSRRVFAGTVLLAAVGIFFFTRDYETQYPQREVLRDSTATVIATGTGMERLLITNGIGMTKLTPSTKMMAHLTLASLDHPPRNVLVICFGMGTTYRSVISWGVPVTAVELVPSVPKIFSYYHEDGAQIMASPFGHVVIDDGRRYLERSSDKYDAIIIDPPPPVQAAGSSLLYSEEFYALAKERLQPAGVLQQWLPAADDDVRVSVARALQGVSLRAIISVYR